MKRFEIESFYHDTPPHRDISFEQNVEEVEEAFAQDLSSESNCFIVAFLQMTSGESDEILQALVKSVTPSTNMQ